VAIDSAGNAWVMNNSGNSVTEMTSLGALAGNFAPVGAALTTPVAAAIDGSGNVWVTNFGYETVTEFVGAATPVVTPIAANLQSPYAINESAVNRP